MSLIGWGIAAVAGCGYLAACVAVWAVDSRGAWKRIHTATRENALLRQREIVQRGLGQLRRQKR